MSAVQEVPDSNKVFKDTVFLSANKHISDQWVSIKELYPDGAKQPLLPETFSRNQFGQGFHYECFMLSALATLVRFPEVIRNCFVTKKVRQDGRYTFQFFRGREWVKVEIDDMIPLEEDEVLHLQSPTEHWWPLLLEKAYAKLYTGYDNLDGCTLTETFHDLTGNPVLNIPMQAKLAKTAGVDIEDPHYWLTIGDYLRHGDYVASTLTNNTDLESIGMQSEQQYAILGVFCMSGSSSASNASDVVVHLHNPFEDEEFTYSGPLSAKDTAWNPAVRAKHDVDNPRSIYMPLPHFMKIANSIQLGLMSIVENDATYFPDAWRGPSAGGNPTSVTWRCNPLYLVRNTGPSSVRLVALIQQEDQRRFTGPDEPVKYIQCGVVVVRSSFPNPIPTFYVTGNNHKPIYKSLFLNSREVANTITIPANSTCYIVPSTMNKGTETDFTLALYRMKGDDYSDTTVEKLDIPGIDWANPPRADVNLTERAKDRIDFYVDEATDIHILLHQTKLDASKKTGDAMTDNYMGMYLYDDTDRRVGGVHAATNFREISVIQRLPRSGRYAISVTCPRAKGEVPAYITISGSDAANARIVDPPEDAQMFDDEDLIDEGDDDANADSNLIDYFPINFPATSVKEMPDSNTPFEDIRFYVDNKAVTNDPWIHIGDLYPEGKTQPLLPAELSRDQFEQGDYFECCCLTAFAALVDHHPDVIRNCFVSKNPRKDGRYTFQFHRYGQWVKVEIDDRIPQIDGGTLYCRSPTRHWWPLLLEKAYAKFYTLYQNLEGCTQEETFHDFTGRPVLQIPTDPSLAKAANLADHVDDVNFWLTLRDEMPNYAVSALAHGAQAEALGLQEDQSYTVLDIIPTRKDADVHLQDILVKLHNPFEEATYTGPMNSKDAAWTPQLRQQLDPRSDKNAIFMPAKTFISAFATINEGLVQGPLEPSWHFNSEWGDVGTNGGNPSLITWRNNPLYVVRNPSAEPVQVVAMVRQPDQRHVMHTLPENRVNYPQVGLTLANANPRSRAIPTYLVTRDNHQLTHKGMFERKREVANLVTIPAKSLSYLVGSCMFHDKSKFVLSYWFLASEDADALKIVRLRPDVARHLPAVTDVALENRGKERVDFLVDTPTNIHILVQQTKPFTSPYGSDVVAEDFVGMYLYDSNNKLSKGVTAAMSYREISLVHHLPAAGRYVLVLSCPRGKGQVPCHVEIVGTEAAHVRLTQPPSNARDLSEIDLAFLDPKPEGIDLALVPIDTDEEFQRKLVELRRLMLDPNADPDEVRRLQEALNARAHELAKAVVGSERPIYLSNRDLAVLNPVLDASEEYMAVEKERYDMKQDPRLKAKAAQHEERLRELADALAEEQANNTNLSFLEPESEGIPVADIPLLSDETFAALMAERARLLKNPEQNASAIATLEGQLNDRAHDLARTIHAQERAFLDPEPEGIPLALLPLNADDEFLHMEAKLRALRNSQNPDPAKVAALEDKLNARAHELARAMKKTERGMFLDPSLNAFESTDAVSPAALDEDPAFHEAELRRLALRQHDPEANAAEIRALEDAMNRRAAELDQLERDSNRAFLRHFGIDPESINALLDEDDAFREMEKRLRSLMKDPAKNAKAIAALQAEMSEEAHRVAMDKRRALRPEYMWPTYRGRAFDSLALDDDEPFLGCEDAYLEARENEARPEKVASLLDAVHARADALARDMNAADRARFLPDTVKGIPREQLALGEDAGFTALEEQRAAALGSGGDAAKLEDALRARAEELATARLTEDRAFLDAKPEGIPIALVGVDADPEFRKLEERRAALRAKGDGDAAAAKNIAALEKSMNDRAHDLARQLKSAAIEDCVDRVVDGVAREQLPLAQDEEVTRCIADHAAALGKGDTSGAEAAARRMNERAAALARARVGQLRAYLDQAPLQVPLDELPLNEDPTFQGLEQEALRLQGTSSSISPVVQSVLDQMNDRARELAEEKLWAEREQFMEAEPEGRALRDLPLNADDEFMALEKKHRALASKPALSGAEQKKLAALEAQMNERAHEIAQALNRQERPNYLGHTVRGLPLESLPLGSDAGFCEMEERRARLARDPVANAAELRALEEEMCRAAQEVADSMLKGDRAFVDQRPEGVPLRQIDLDDDSTFKQLEQRRAALKADPARSNTSEVTKLEAQMNDRARDMAAEVKAQGRAKLEQTQLGIPLGDLPLDADERFCALEEQFRDAEKAKDEALQARLLAALNERAEQLADEMHERERANLVQRPRGIPLDALPLNEDTEFLRLEGEARAIRKRNPKDSRLPSVEEKLNGRARELANEMRRNYCDEAPQGIPLDLLDLGSDPAFAEKEASHLARAAPGRGNATRSLEALQPANDELNSLAHAAARRMIVGDRDKYLDPNPEGIPFAVLPLDTDADFHAKEVERARLKAEDAALNSRRIADLEKQLNDRAHELAIAQKEADLEGLDPEPAGIPIALLHPHDDPTFASMVDKLRAMKADPKRNTSAIDSLKDDIDAHCEEMALGIQRNDRGFLHPTPEGVPVGVLPLDDDEIFQAKQAQRATLKLTDARRYAPKVKALEDELNERAAELAKAQRREDLLGVEEAPGGIPKTLLGLHEDAMCKPLIDQLRELKKQRKETGANNAAAMKTIEEKMNERAGEIARQRLDGDRAYLDPTPAGIPLADLPLDTDEAFRAMEVERAKLKSDTERKAANAAEVKRLESDLNDRAYQLALATMEEDLKLFKPAYQGILTKHLKPHKDPLFAELAARNRRRRRDPAVTWAEDLERVMDDRLDELAREQNDGELYFLDPAPQGVALEDLPLHSDAAFTAMQKQREKLKAIDPLGKRGDIHKLETDMNARAHELARKVVGDDFAEMDQAPLGIPLELLKPRDDPVLAGLVEDLRRARRPPQTKDRAAAVLQNMNNRAHELAKSAIDEGRDRYLDANPEGIPLDVLPIETDPAFNKLAVERAIRKLQPGATSEDATTTAKLEEKLNARAHELAREQIAEDLKGIDAEPEGVPLALLHPHEDPVIGRAIEENRVLKRDPVRNADKIKSKQAAMNERAHDLAKKLLASDRASYLDPAPLGVTLAELPLDSDRVFHALEAERAKALAAENDKGKVAALEQQLRDRSEELAQAQLSEDLVGLAPAPLGVPLSLMAPHRDAEFAALVPELRQLKKDPARNAGHIKAQRGKLDGRDFELAEAFLDADRDAYLDPEPEGLPWRSLNLSENPEFKELENKKLALQAAAAEEPNSKKGLAALEEVKALQGKLNAVAHQLACEQLESDRAYLDSHPEGVPLEFLPLDTDPVFHDMETQRALLKAKRSLGAAEAMEGKLNDRAHELARAQKAEDLKGLNQHPRGVPLAALKPHDDAKFAVLVGKLRKARRQPGSSGAAKNEIDALHAEMNKRADELALAALQKDRDYLDARPGHVPVSRLPLDTDKAFAAMEGERATLTFADPNNSKDKIAALEDKLNARAHELAKAVKANDLQGLRPAPSDLPLEIIDPHKDAKFSALAEERAALPPKQRGDASHPVVKSLNKRAAELAGDMLQGDRGYLAKEPEGVSVAKLPLDMDEAFHKDEVARAILKAQDPKRNAEAITERESRLNDRAAELARMLLAQDRSYLDQNPEGVPLAVLPLNTDPKFHAMEMERAKAKGRSTPADVARAKEIEAKLNARAHELAKRQLEEDLEGLEREPAGYPLVYLKPHKDGAFASIVEPTLRAAKKAGHTAKVEELKQKLNHCATEYAKKRTKEDRAFLNPTPEDVPLELLPLDTDAVFRAAEKDLRAAKAAVDESGLEMHAPAPETAAVREAQDRMDARAHELARALLHSNRGFLDAEPEGVPLAEVPLDSDATFRNMEVQRLRMLGDPKKQDDVTKLEEHLRERVRELARGVKDASRGFLNATSHGVPRQLLLLDGDKEFLKGEKDLRRALAEERSRPRDAAAVAATKKIKASLQERADAIGKRQVVGERGRYLADLPTKTGVEVADLDLDSDRPFTGMEVERAILIAKDPVRNQREIEKLKAALEERAEELAKQLIAADREFLPEDILGVPKAELPLDEDDKFKRLERVRRGHRRDGASEKAQEEDKEAILKHAEELAGELVAEDLAALKAAYRNIPVEDLGLHSDDKFRELAGKRRRCRGKGRVDAPEIAMIEDEMERRACEIADDVIDNERGFLDPEPEGMYLRDVPLDDDPVFTKMEGEYRRRARDPRTAHQNKEVLRELAGEMNQRSHALARAEFAKMRGFMTQAPEGIPLNEIGLDEDPEFKECEIARYRKARSGAPDPAFNAEMERCMEARAAELARAMLAADRGFLDPEPEGVPLSFLPLDADAAFCQLARDRRKSKKGLKKGKGDADVRRFEDQMNERCHDMARAFLDKERAFLDSEPEGVPIADVPLHSDAPFRAMENDRIEMKRQLNLPIGTASSAAAAQHPKLAALEAALNDRAHVAAKDLLRKERAFLDPEPLGVALDELPLNHDSELNPIERKRRACRRDPKNHLDTIRACEQKMHDRVNAIAESFIEEERAFLDQEPEGVPLRYLPLSSDREFREMELRRRKLRHKPEGHRDEIGKLEEKMNTRAHTLARDLIRKGRAFLHPEPLGVPIADVPLNGDEIFRRMEEQRRRLKEDTSGRDNTEAVRGLEDHLNKRAHELAQELLDEERAFMQPEPVGIPLEYLSLNEDRRMQEIERARRRLRKSETPERYAADVRILEDGMDERALELARKALADNRGFLDPEPCGVPLEDLPLETDPAFHSMELQHFQATKKGKGSAVLDDLEDRLAQRVYEMADEFIQRERAYLDPAPVGIPISQLPLDKDMPFHSMELERRHMVRNGAPPEQIQALEDQLNRRAYELALEIRGWQDVDFHEANRHVAEEWPRVRDLYPEGRTVPLLPTEPLPSDVDSADLDAGYLAPFIAALGRHPVLLQRLIASEEHPVHGPYSFVFFDPSSNPVFVKIDDRVPCDARMQPKFTLSPERMWYPLLLEKAYAKFVGGYENLDNCTPHETLHDLTGRPVTHVPFDRKLAEAANTGDYTSVNFWLRVAEDMAHGDVILCLSNAEGDLDGIHPQCSYTLLGVIETVEGTVNPADIVIKLHNAYRSYGPVYNGPLCANDANWSDDLRRICRYNPERSDILYMPLPTFLRNFSSMQNCHINCGDRLTATGAWDKLTAGGNPRFTTFRNNPIFIVENKSTRPAVVLTELRHNGPTFVDPDGVSHYPQTGLVLMQPTNPSAPLTPLITNNTYKFLQKGMMLDSREVCSVMELPASSTCAVVPYTMRSGECGTYSLSVYPGMARVTLTPLHFAGLVREPTSTKLVLAPGEDGRRVDFTITSACEVHVLLHQDKMIESRSSRKGDTIADDDVVMTAFSDQGMRLASSGDATNARMHALAFRASQPGRYSLLVTSPNQPVSGDCPITLSVFVPKKTSVKFVAPPTGARPLQQVRFPTLPKAAQRPAKGNRPPSSATRAASQPGRADTLPPLPNHARAATSSVPLKSGAARSAR